MKKGRCGRPGRTAWDARLKWMNPIRPQPPFGFTGGGGGGAAPPSPPKAAPDYTAEAGPCREFWRQVQPGGSVRGTEQRDSERILGQHSVWACQCGTYNLRVGRSAQPGGGRADGFRASVWRAGSNGSGGHGAGGGGKGEVELRQPLFSGQNSSLRPE